MNTGQMILGAVCAYLYLLMAGRIFGRTSVQLRDRGIRGVRWLKVVLSAFWPLVLLWGVFVLAKESGEKSAMEDRNV